MAIIAKESGGNFTPAPEGSHIARCFGVVSLGVQHSDIYADSAKLMLIWELPDVTVKTDGKDAPMTVQKEYTLSLSEKSNLRKDLQSWRGRAFTKEELAGFEVSKIVGQPCLLSIVHKTSGKGSAYAAIQSVMGVPKGTVVAKQHHESVIYEVEQGRNPVFEKLPPWIQKKIEACEEWTNPAVEQEHHSTGESQDDTDSEVPF